MKLLKHFAIAFVLFITATNLVTAQSKVAHIDVQQLLSEMPEMKAAQTQLQNLEKSYKADLESSVTELRNKYTQYGNEADSKTPQENEKRAQELKTMQDNIAAAEQTASQDLQKKQLELYKPIMEKAQKAVQKVARAKGYQYVLDASNGTGVILADGKDLLSDVKKELGF